MYGPSRFMYLIIPSSYLRIFRTSWTSPYSLFLFNVRPPLAASSYSIRSNIVQEPAHPSSWGGGGIWCMYILWYGTVIGKGDAVGLVWGFRRRPERKITTRGASIPIQGISITESSPLSYQSINTYIYMYRPHWWSHIHTHTHPKNNTLQPVRSIAQ